MPNDVREPGCFGKLAAVDDPRTLRFAKYAEALPAPPPEFHALTRVGANLKVKNPVSLFPMLGNDTRGDCTIAACAHAETLWEAFCNKRRVPSTQAVLKDYFRLTGGDDTGLVELNVLNDWRKNGITGEKILAYAAVDWTDLDILKLAMSLFGCVYIGFTVQHDALSDFRAHRPWKAGTPTRGGHAVILTGYDDAGLSLLTWGALQKAEYGWLDMVDEAYAVLGGESVVPGFHPQFDYAQLRADLDAVTA